MFRNGDPHGQGKYAYPDRGVYEGMFVKGRRHGQGKFEFSDGGMYEGMFVNGKPRGQGKYEYPDGSMYEGMFVNGKPHGQGKYEYSDRSMYEGMFVNGERGNGKGKYTCADGSVYDGMWVDGKQHGFFVNRTPAGTYVNVFYTNESKVDVKKADWIVTTIQAHARGFLERKLAKRMRAEQNTQITAEDAMQKHLKELERKELRNGIVTSKKRTPNTNARVPQTVGRTRQGGGRTRDKRQQRASGIQKQDDAKKPWSEEVLEGELKKQMDRGRHERATAANTNAGPIAPSYLDVLDLHEYTKAEATEKLRAKICELKPLKHCNHLMVITGKGQHGEYACIKGHVRQLLDGAWHASYIVKRAGDGKGTDGFYVKITKKLKKDVKNAKDSQLSPTRPTVVVRPRAVHPGN